MSQQRDVMEQKGPNQVVHIRSDSETNLDELFKAVMHPKDSQVPLTVPMRLRNLPPSFFKQPEKGSKSASHSRESSTDGTTYTAPTSVPAGSPQPQQQQQVPSGLQINHPRAHSSPASLQQAYSNNPAQHQHLRQQSYDIIDDNTPLPPGWEMAKTVSGQMYFLNHLTQTTTWEDPRKKSTTSTLPTAGGQTINLQNIGPLPKGWEQATTPEGEVYFINHIDRTTSWLDPRIPAHLQHPPLIQSPSLNAQRQQVLSSQQNQPPQVQGNTTSSHASPLPAQSIALAASISAAVTTTTGAVNNQNNAQQRQQKLRLQRLQMERERLRIRQQEIIRQSACLGNPILNEMILRQTLGEELTIPTSPTGTTTELPPVSSTGIDPFLGGGTDFHSRQESADSGLGLGPNYSLPHTPEDFLSNMDDVDDPSHQSSDLGLDLQASNLDLGDENMDSDDLVPSLQEELNADILSDVEALLSSGKDSVLTWL